MRKGLAAAVVCLGLAMPGYAQQGAASSFFTGVNPLQLTNKTIDLSHTRQAPNLSNAFHPVTQPKAFSLANIFHPFTMPSWPPRSAQSIFPANVLQQQAAWFSKQPVLLDSSALPTMTVGQSPFGIPGVGK
jgi:hypothetical protein